jgi:hypothetical protein
MNKEHARRVLDFQEIQRLVPLTAVLARFGLLESLKRSGAQLVGACPIHQGTNRRQFVVDPRKNVWRCFGDCDRGGSTIELVAALEGVAVKEAAELIAGWFAIAPSRSASSQHVKRRSKQMTDANPNRPTHKVYSAAKRDGQKDYLTRIGSGWSFVTKDDRAGLNIQLTAMPIGDRMVLFEADAEELEAEEEPAKKGNARRK